jgi:Phosphotransferase enzyme family
MINEWKACLLSRAKQWGVPASGDWRFLFYNNYHPQCSDMDVLWFHNGQQFPGVVTKISREPGRPEREFANLQQVHASAPQWVPEPLHFGAQGNLWMLWMKGVPGMRFTGKHTPDVLRTMAGTVTSIHKAVARPPGSARVDRYRRTVAEPLEALTEFGTSVAVREGCRRLAARATVELIGALPVVPQHGDLYAGNLLENGGHWYVVDWESFGMVDLPMYDLYTLLLSMLQTRGSVPAEWSPELTGQMPSLVKKYAQELGVPLLDVPVLLPLTLANWFYIQWSDGRAKFSAGLYEVIEGYFAHESSWEKVFFA